MTPALFLDRDGVINQDRHYVHRIADFEFLPGIFDLCATARRLGMAIHVVTNQAGIGRGLYSEADFSALSQWMCGRFAERGITIAAVHHCPFHPEHGLGAYRADSPRRKPAPGMVLDAAAEHRLDLPASAMIGDKITDIQAARAAGVGTRILLAGSAAEIAALAPGEWPVASLAKAAAILQQIRSSA